MVWKHSLAYQEVSWWSWIALNLQNVTLKYSMQLDKLNFGLCNSLQCHSGAYSALESDKAQHGCWWCQQWGAGDELGPSLPGCLCLSLLSGRCQRGVEVLHRLLCTRARKGSVGVEADGCVWMMFWISMERQEERRKRKEVLESTFPPNEKFPRDVCHHK